MDWPSLGLGDLAGLSGEARKLAMYYGVYSFAGALYGFISIFYVTALGYSAAFFGELSAIGEASLVLSLLATPHVASKAGARGAAILGTGITAASALGLAVSSAPIALGAAFAGAGVGQAMVSPTFSSLVSAAEPRERRTAAFVASGVSNQLGAFVGTALSGTAADILQPSLGRIGAYRMVIAMASAAMIPAILLIQGTPVDLRPNGNPWRMGEASRRVAWRLIAAAMLIGAGAGFLIPYFPLQFKYRFGSSTAYISQLFSVTNLVMAVIMLYMPELERRLGSLRSIVGSWIIATAFMVAMPAAAEMPFGLDAFSALYLLRTTVMNAIGPVQSSFELSMIDPSDRPAFSSLETLAWNAANAGTVVLGGIIMQASLDAPFYICGVFYAAAAVFYYGSFAHGADARTERRARRDSNPRPPG